MPMRVFKYIPERLYGFTVDDAGLQVFFHLGIFTPGTTWKEHAFCISCPFTRCSWCTTPPPPILGEPVDVSVNLSRVPEGEKAPRATKVARIASPVVVKGLVETFDVHRGYGFIAGEDSRSYHLHKSEIQDGRLPRTGQVVMFYAGMRQGKPRACHIKVCP